MQNLQILPGDTDLDHPMPDDQRSPNGDNRDETDKIPVPPDKMPSVPVKEPNPHRSINENPREPQRIMSFFTAAQRRIF